MHSLAMPAARLHYASNMQTESVTVLGAHKNTVTYHIQFSILDTWLTDSSLVLWNRNHAVLNNEVC